MLFQIGDKVGIDSTFSLVFRKFGFITEINDDVYTIQCDDQTIEKHKEYRLTLIKRGGE